MLRYAGRCVAALIISSALLAPAYSAEKIITVGTAGIIGAYYALGNTLCKLVNAKRAEHGYYCVVESTTGSVHNIREVMAGHYHIGFAQSDVQSDAITGKGRFKGTPLYGLRALFSLHPEIFTVVVRADIGITKFTDLRGKRVNIGHPGSGTRSTTEQVMQQFGIGKENFLQVTNLEFVKMAPALCDGRIDAFTYVSGHPNAIFLQAATNCDSRIIAITGPEIDQLIKSYSYYVPAQTPGGIYPGTLTPQSSFAMLATIVASAQLPEEFAYFITRTVFENIDAMKKGHPAAATLDAAKMLQANTAPFHPGALKYFREKGLRP